MTQQQIMGLDTDELLEDTGLPEPDKTEFTPPKIHDRNVDGWIDDLVGAISDPIIVHAQGGWGNDIPEKIAGDIQMARLVQLMQKQKGDPEGELATWPEVCWYLSTASLDHPFDHTWTEIYMFAFTKYKGDEAPEDLRAEKLNQYVMNDLTYFRRWLYNKRRSARKEALRTERREEKQAKATKVADNDPVEQVGFEFDFEENEES